MPDFAFRSYGGKADSDDDVMANRGSASKLRDSLKKTGHDARVERGYKGENRVWIQHPKHKDIAAYVTRGDADALHKGQDPRWIRK